MSAHASYIFTAYSHIRSLPLEKLLLIGNSSQEGIPIPSFDEDLLINICEEAKDIFEKEDNIIYVEGDVVVVGDIHGSFHDLLRILKYVDGTESKVIFLGDYVDRGSFSLECITLLFTLKLLRPEKYFLLRGNHEFEDMCSCYGFKKEILNYHNPYIIEQNNHTTTTDKYESPNKLRKFQEEKQTKKSHLQKEELCINYYKDHVNINCYKYTEKLFQTIMETFSYLPFCSIVNKTSLCFHGGLTPLLEKVENINRSIQRPITDFDQSPLLTDILWGDPSPDLEQSYTDNHRGRGKLFNGPVLVNFLKNNNLKRLIRGHECVNGVKKLFNEKCITVFSASSYSCDMGNSSGILKIFKNDDRIKSVIFQPLSRLKKFDSNYYKVQSFCQTQSSHSIKEYKSGFLQLGNFSPDPNHHLSIHFLNDDENDRKLEHKHRYYPHKVHSLRSGHRKNVSSSNFCLISKPQILAPKISQNRSQILFSTATESLFDENINE